MIAFSFTFVLFLGAALTTGEDTLIKEGVCPLRNLPLRCPLKVKSACAVDVDCHGRDKCCNDGCKLVCMPPSSHPSRIQDTKSGEQVCEAALDLGFLVDSSASIGYKNFKKIQKVMQEVVQYYTISERGTHIAAILIDSQPKLAFGFNTLKGIKLTTLQVLRLIRSMQYTKGKTRIDLALNMASKKMFSKYGGSRRNVRKILVVFTDGKQTWEPAIMMPLKKTAESLKEKGVQIIPVGFGSETLNIGSLMDMASDEDFIFNMDFIPEFLDAMGKISKINCSKKSNAMDKTLAFYLTKKKKKNGK